jgi:succinoglycan biosynthesis transport protein ExoP
MNFWRAVEILNKRKWLILFSIIATIVFTFGGTRLVGSRWQGTVRFVTPGTSSALSSAGPGGPANEGESAEGPMAVVAAKNQANVYEATVKRRAVLEPVLLKLRKRELPPNFLKNVEFVAVGPKLFELRVVDSSPARAEEYANALADQFQKVNHDLNTERAKKVVTLLEEQVDQAEKKVKEIRTKYDDYRAQHEIIGAENHNLELALSRLRDSRQKRDEIAQMLAESQAELQQNETDVSKPQEAVVVEEAPAESNSVAMLKVQLTQADDQLAKLRLRYTEQNDAVKKALAAHEEIAAKLKDESAKAKKVAVARPGSPQQIQRQDITNLKHTVAGYRGQLAALDGTVRSATADIQKYKGVDGPLAELVTELSERTERSSNLKLRLNSAHMAMDVAERQNPITILDRVSPFNPPTNLSAGRTSKLIAIAALCALMATGGIIIGLDSIDRRLRNVREAELVLPSRVLAAIPQPMGQVTYSSLARATELHPQSIHSEAYRFLGLDLLNPRNSHIKSLMVLSAKAEQGSTTTLTNLGITLAQAGKRVIVVDANIRTAELHTVFGVDNDFGFTDVVRQPSRSNLDKALRRTTVKNLEVVTSGTTPTNPWELFHDSHIHDLSHALLERADYVLYDTPSAAIFTDAFNLAPIIDAAFLCVRALEQLTGAEQRMIEQIEQANVQVLGSVLTDVPAAVVEGYRNYQHYYRPGAQASEDAGASAGPVAIAPSLIELPRNSEDHDS